MAASFPAAQKSFAQQTDDISDADAADVNAIYDEVEAIESHLGAGSIAAGQVVLTGTAPWLRVYNTAEEDTDGGRESQIQWRGEQSGGEISTLGLIEISHDGASDDEKGKFLLKLNDGDDTNSPTTYLTVDAAGLLTHLGAITIGVDGTGHDVMFYGDTSGSYLFWDESDDALEFVESKMTMTTATETASDPGRQMYLQRIHTSTLGSGKGLTGVEVRSTFNGSADALNSEVKGGEFKARHTTGNTYDVGTFKGVTGNVDCKNGTVTTGWAVEGAIDVSSGGTFTTAACFHGNLNNSGTVTNSYGVYVHGLSGNVLTRGLYVDYATTGLYLDNCTTDIRFQNGATIVNDSADLLTITEATIATVGKLQFGGATDWGTGATGTQITGAGYDWVSQTVGRVNTDLNNCAAAAAYHAMSVTADQTGSNTVLGTWTELYIKTGLNLPSSNNYVSVWGNLEIGADVETASISNCVTALLGSLTIGATYDNDARTCGCLVTMNYDNTGAAGSGRISAFEMSIANDVFDYGLYIPDSTATTGIDIGDCSTAGIDITGDCGVALRIGAAGSGLTVDYTTRDYLTEMTSATDTGAQSYSGNIGTQYNRHEIDAAAVITSSSFICASMNRIEIAGGNTNLGTPWIVGVMGYIKNPSGTVTASSATVHGVVGMVNVATDYTSTAEITSAVCAASYSNAGATITHYCGFYIPDLGAKDFTEGLYIEDGSCTTGISLGSCTTGIDLTGTMTDGIKLSGIFDTAGINITSVDCAIGLLYNVDHAAAPGAANVMGVKVILERTTDVIVASGSYIGGEFVIKKGDTGGSNKCASNVTGIRIAMDGSETLSGLTLGLKVETQGDGNVDWLEMLQVNNGGSVSNGILAVSLYENAPTGIHFVTDDDVVLGSAFSFDEGGVDYGTISAIMSMSRMDNCAHLIKFGTAATTGFYDATGHGSTQAGRIKIEVDGHDRYLHVWED